MITAPFENKNMLKKIIILLVLAAFLTACGNKPKIEFVPPTTGPDLDQFQPEFGPNDSISTEEPAL